MALQETCFEYEGEYRQCRDAYKQLKERVERLFPLLGHTNSRETCFDLYVWKRLAGKSSISIQWSDDKFTFHRGKAQKISLEHSGERMPPFEVSGRLMSNTYFWGGCKVYSGYVVVLNTENSLFQEGISNTVVPRELSHAGGQYKSQWW